MKFIDKNVYGDWDSPHTFCQYQLDDEEDGFLCSDLVFEDDTNDPDKCKCPYVDKKAAKKCKLFKYHKHNKNPNAKRYAGSKI